MSLRFFIMEIYLSPFSIAYEWFPRSSLEEEPCKKKIICIIQGTTVRPWGSCTLQPMKLYSIPSASSTGSAAVITKTEANSIDCAILSVLRNMGAGNIAESGSFESYKSGYLRLLRHTAVPDGSCSSPTCLLLLSPINAMISLLLIRIPKE